MLKRKARRGPNPNSRLRQRVAVILSKHFGWEVYPEDISPVQGFYRSNPMADIYRWELFTRDDCGHPFVVGCWETLTEFVKQAPKHGFHVDDGVIYLGQKISLERLEEIANHV